MTSTGSGAITAGGAPRHIVFATAGSLGDLHPFLALGRELRRRGHRVTVATNAGHEPHVAGAGLAFHHMRPDPENTPAFHGRYMHPKTGGEFVYREYLGPAIRSSYADLAAASKGADLLVSQSLMALAAPLVAGATGIPWVSAVLQPMSFFSVHERPNYLPAPLLSWLCGRSPGLHGRVFHYVRKHTEDWIRPVMALKAELGIARRDHPMYEGQHSAQCVLAMFSPLLGEKKPDWPAAAVQTGTALYLDQASELPQDLRRFLQDGGAPLAIFTLGSAASNDAGSFYADGLAAAGALGMRALLVTGGPAGAAPLPSPLPDSAMSIRYAPFEAIFAHASVIVHSGGVATSFKALQSGAPQVIVPHAHDQLDNALRLRALGAALVLPRQRAGRRALRRAIALALRNRGMGEAAARLAAASRAEDGVQAACDVIEGVLGHA